VRNVRSAGLPRRSFSSRSTTSCWECRGKKSTVNRRYTISSAGAFALGAATRLKPWYSHSCRAFDAHWDRHQGGQGCRKARTFVNVVGNFRPALSDYSLRALVREYGAFAKASVHTRVPGIWEASLCGRRYFQFPFCVFYTKCRNDVATLFRGNGKLSRRKKPASPHHLGQPEERTVSCKIQNLRALPSGWNIPVPPARDEVFAAIRSPRIAHASHSRIAGKSTGRPIRRVIKAGADPQKNKWFLNQVYAKCAGAGHVLVPAGNVGSLGFGHFCLSAGPGFSRTVEGKSARPESARSIECLPARLGEALFTNQLYRALRKVLFAFGQAGKRRPSSLVLRPGVIQFRIGGRALERRI